MQRAKDILSLVYSRHKGTDEEKDQELALCYWAATVGPQIAQRSTPIRVLGRRLIVDVEGQDWRRQLASMSRSIAKRMNGAMGKEILDDVDFRVRVPRGLPPRSAMTAAGAGDPHDEASGIRDPNLRRIYRESKKKALGK